MENKPSKSPVIFAVVAWMIINSIFFLLELTIFGDYMDLNNSIELALWLVSIAGILSMRKGGAALVTFTLIYSFSFNAFNVIYFPPHVSSTV